MGSLWLGKRFGSGKARRAATWSCCWKGLSEGVREMLVTGEDQVALVSWVTCSRGGTVRLKSLVRADMEAFE